MTGRSDPGERGEADPEGDRGTWVRDEEDRLVRRDSPQPLSEAIAGRVGRRPGWRDRLEGAAIFSRWEAIVGEELARRCEPVRLAGGRLVVRAESATWATQVRYLVEEIRHRANHELRPGLVKSVEVVVGGLRGGSAGPGAGGAQGRPPVDG